MRKALLLALCFAVLIFPCTQVQAQPASRAAVASEIADHPRIATAIHDLEDAIAYMEAAPHNFGGHKAAAIAASRKAIAQLEKAMAYRARRDGR